MRKLLILIVIVIISSSCNTKTNNLYGFDSSSVNQGKSIIDSSLENYQNKYYELCGGKRNDDLKYEYQDLRNSILNLYNIGKNSKNLSYLEQNEITEYTINKIEDFPDLKNLTQTGNVNCW